MIDIDISITRIVIDVVIDITELVLSDLGQCTFWSPHRLSTSRLVATESNSDFLIETDNSLTPALELVFDCTKVPFL